MLQTLQLKQYFCYLVLQDHKGSHWQINNIIYHAVCCLSTLETFAFYLQSSTPKGYLVSLHACSYPVIQTYQAKTIDQIGKGRGTPDHHNNENGWWHTRKTACCPIPSGYVWGRSHHCRHSLPPICRGGQDRRIEMGARLAWVSCLHSSYHFLLPFPLLPFQITGRKRVVTGGWGNNIGNIVKVRWSGGRQKGSILCSTDGEQAIPLLQNFVRTDSYYRTKASHSLPRTAKTWKRSLCETKTFS